MYAIKLDDKDRKKSKEIQKSTIKNKISFDDYKKLFI